MKITTEENLVFIPEFIKNVNKFYIPKKLHKSIDFIPQHLLTEINSNIEVAKEICLLFTSYLVETLFDEFKDGKHLLSSNLAKYLSSAKCTTQDNTTYQMVIKALTYGTPEKGPIITVNIHYVPGEYSRTYNLTDTYKKGIQIYTLKTKYVKDMKHRNNMLSLIKANTNDIAINNLKLYSLLDLPTKEQLLVKAKELIKNNYTTKKGKILTMQYRKDKSYWKDADNRSFVERDIEMFEFYTNYGFMIPVIGDEHCPRVYDSISLMPSWIRKEIKKNNEELFEVDYSCLHPNLIMNIYKGSTKYITHEQVANDLNLDVKYVKTKHLSFFNLKPQHFKSSKLYNYYDNKEQRVTWEILEDKKINGHKVASKLLLTLETELMTKVIKKLNNLNIYPAYIYDALMVTKSEIEITNKIMNDTALEMNIFTTAKSEICNNEIILEEKEVSLEESKTQTEEVYVATKEDYMNQLNKWHTNIEGIRFFKENKDVILNELVSKQLNKKQDIIDIIKKYN